MNPLDQRWQMVRDRWPIRVKNGSGSVIPPFSLVLTSSASAVNNEIVVTVVKPNAAAADFNFCGYLVTGPFAIGSGSSNEGLASNLVQPNYLSLDFTGATGNVCGPKHGQFTAARHYLGYRIVGDPETVNGVKVAVAKNIGVSTILGKMDNASVSPGSTCTVSVWAGLRPTEVDTTMNITNVANLGANITSATTKWCMVFYNGEQPYLGYVACTVI